jgi:hypothetical protein
MSNKQIIESHQSIDQFNEWFIINQCIKEVGFDGGQADKLNEHVQPQESTL